MNLFTLRGKGELEELEDAIVAGIPPEEMGRKFFDATQHKYAIRISDKERELACRYGATLNDVTDIKKFYDAMRRTLPQDGNISLARLGDTVNSIVRGFFEAGKVNSAQNAIGACRMLSKNPLWANPLEKEILKNAFPLLKGNDLIAFASALSMQSLMQLSFMLGYQPSATFDEAVKAYRDEERRAEEAERNRTNCVM